MSVGKLLGIDHGMKRIGVAVSDGLGVTARELIIIHRQSKAKDFARLNQIAREEKATAFIVGLPLQDAPEGTYTQADRVRVWTARLQATTDLPIILWDEQFTSHDARELARLQKRQPREPIDDLAARLILQSYLDALRGGLAPPPLRLNN